MFFIKIYINESYINYYHTIIQMCGQYCILAPIPLIEKLGGVHMCSGCTGANSHWKANDGACHLHNICKCWGSVALVTKPAWA